MVAILEKKHSRAAGGHLRPMLDVNHSFATFAPTDSRVPRMMIPTNDLPKGQYGGRSFMVAPTFYLLHQDIVSHYCLDIHVQLHYHKISH